MTDLSNRRSILLKEYDYSHPGAYFVTICTRERECLFGEIVNGEIRLNDAGRMVQTVWDELPCRFLGLQSDAFVVMPNHVHGVIIFVGAGLALPDGEGAASSAPTLGDVMRAFKSMSAIRINRMVMRHGSLWQRNYYEHGIRNDDDLKRTREYVVGNPALWDKDDNNPALLKPH